jgi:cobalt-zinc-cadmium efflux system protein
MSHDHSHGDHSHGHGITTAHSESRLTLALLLTLAFVVGEAIAGWTANSLALLSDAGHNFADALALGLSLYAVLIAKKSAHSRMTFGYHRVGILAALINAVSLVVIAIIISMEAIQRLAKPEPTQSGLMIGVAVVAVAVNLLIGYWLHHGRHDLNIRSVYIHMLGDAVSAAGVVVAGIVVALTKSTTADPLISFVIAALIVWSSYGILKESVNVLLEGTPAGINMGAVEECILKVSGVLNVHDLHVWTVGPGVIACSCHVMVSEQTISSGQQILKVIVEELQHRFNITHTTVQVEVEGCAPNDLYCKIK